MGVLDVRQIAQERSSSHLL